MFYMALYFAAAYAPVGFLALWMWERKRLRPPKRVLATVALLSLPLLPYARVALQTRLHRDALLPPLYRALHWTAYDDPAADTVRVMNISRNHAEVYVVEPCQYSGGRAGLLLDLVKDGGEWRVEGENAVWSDCGSADGNTFPPYPDAKEF